MNKSESTKTFLSWTMTVFKVAIMATGIFLFFVFITGFCSLNKAQVSMETTGLEQTLTEKTISLGAAIITAKQ